MQPIILSPELTMSGVREYPLIVQRRNVTLTKEITPSAELTTFEGAITSHDGATVAVLIKSATSNPVSLLEEAALLTQFRHPNVLALVGVVTLGRPVMSLLEYCEMGQLDTFLQSNTVTQSGKLEIARACARGCSYLASRMYVHSNIRASNVQVNSNGEPKISGFSFNRVLREECCYVRYSETLPIRWTAPEILDDSETTVAVHTEQSDVWSFGVLLYEIYSDGAVPYGEWRNERVWVKVTHGYRLPLEGVIEDADVRKVVGQCWAERGGRISFEEVVQGLGA